jgi:hypothetical protein
MPVRAAICGTSNRADQRASHLPAHTLRPDIVSPSFNQNMIAVLLGVAMVLR